MPPCIEYTPHRFSAQNQVLVGIAVLILEEYQKQGYELTLRQLYYQFVARGHLENTERAYKLLGKLINDARLAGVIDWQILVDRTRHLESLPHWESPQDIVEDCAEQYARDKWASQSYRIEVWVEKEALAGVVEAACRPMDVPFFCCRGYVSQSEMWRAGKRMIDYIDNEQTPIILYLGDHDPSGLDMVRDIEDRLDLFISEMVDGYVKVVRLALTWEQIEQYNPPPNPAKVTDSRFENYQVRYGNDSWELDALEPTTITDLITQAVKEYCDAKRWEEAAMQQIEEQEILLRFAESIKENSK